METKDKDTIRNELMSDIIDRYAILSSDEAMKDIHGFTMTEYIAKREETSNKLREIAVRVRTIVRNSGYAKTTGGATGISSGILTVGGIALAPFTGGASLGFTALGAAMGVASSATSVSAAVMKDRKIKKYSKNLNSALEELEEMDKEVNELIKEIKDMTKKLNDTFSSNKEAAEWFEESLKYGGFAKTIGYDVGYKGYTVYKSVDAVNFAKAVYSFIGSDFGAMGGVTRSFAAPGISVFGKTLVIAGSTTAKSLTAISGIAGIGFGVYEVMEGSKEIKISEEADEIEKTADDLDEITKNYKELVETLKNATSDTKYGEKLDHDVSPNKDYSMLVPDKCKVEEPSKEDSDNQNCLGF